MITFFINALKIIFLLGFLVLIHEGGHFLVAKYFKVKVNEFSIGFGKILFSKQKGETKYCLRMIPFGGFVSMEGEDERSDDNGSFSKKSIPKRMAIIVAGGLVNIVFGILVYFVLASVAGQFYSTKIDQTVKNYGAEIAGIQENDEIVKVNDKKIHLYTDIEKILEKSKGKKIPVEINRDGKNLVIDVIPTEEKSKSIGIYLGTEDDASTKIEYIYKDSPADKAGIEIGDVIKEVNGNNINNGDYEKVVELIDNSEENVKIKIDRHGEEKEFNITPVVESQFYLGVRFKSADKNLINNLYYGFWSTVDFTMSLADNVKSLFTGGISTDQLMGPVGISKTVASTSSLEEFIYLMALISLSLGITNLLPFPALDGGKFVLLILEAIRKKPLKENTEVTIQLIGFSLLILLSIYISYNDILRFF